MGLVGTKSIRRQAYRKGGTGGSLGALAPCSRERGGWWLDLLLGSVVCPVIFPVDSNSGFQMCPLLPLEALEDLLAAMAPWAA